MSIQRLAANLVFRAQISNLGLRITHDDLGQTKLGLGSKCDK